MHARAVALAIALTGVLCLAPAADGAGVRSFPITVGGPHAVAPSTDGSSIFVGARDCGYLGRFDIASSSFATFLGQPTLPCTLDGTESGRGPFATVQGPDGKLYFTIYDGDAIDGTGQLARINPNGTDLEAENGGKHPLDITVGPDGNIWFTANGPPGQVGRVKQSPFGVELFKVPGDVQGPRGIVDGGDGNLYVLGGEAGVIWKVTTAAEPVITQVASGLEGPSFGERGPDGKIWFTLFEGSGVTSFDPAGATKGPVTPVSGGPWDVAFGTDGNAYATRLLDNSIAQLVPGQPGFNPLALPTTNGLPAFIAGAPDGKLYAAGQGENTLFEVTPEPRPANGGPTPPADTDPPDTKLKKKPAKRSEDRTPTFVAKADEAGSKFRCKLDRKPFKPCKARKTFSVKPGTHVVKIAAVDSAGNVDPKPVKFKFTVLE